MNMESHLVEIQLAPSDPEPINRNERGTTVQIRVALSLLPALPNPESLRSLSSALRCSGLTLKINIKNSIMMIARFQKNVLLMTMRRIFILRLNRKLKRKTGDFIARTSITSETWHEAPGSPQM